MIKLTYTLKVLVYNIFLETFYDKSKKSLIFFMAFYIFRKNDFFFEKEFQPIASIPDDNFLSSNQDIN